MSHLIFRVDIGVGGGEKRLEAQTLNGSVSVFLQHIT